MQPYTYFIIFQEKTSKKIRPKAPFPSWADSGLARLGRAASPPGPGPGIRRPRRPAPQASRPEPSDASDSREQARVEQNQPRPTPP